MCYSCCQSRLLCGNDLQCKELQEVIINAPSVTHMFMSKMGAILHITDSSSSINFYTSDIYDESFSGTEKQWC